MAAAPVGRTIGVLAIERNRGHLIQVTAKKSSSHRPKVAGYRVAGVTTDGIAILAPKTRPSSFTTKQIRATVKRVLRESGTGRFVSEADLHGKLPKQR